MWNSLGNKQIFAKNLKRFMERDGVDRNKLCVDLGFNYTTVCGWLSAQKYPRIDKIELMAHYFRVSKADLIEDPSKFPVTQEEKSLLKRLATTCDSESDIERIVEGVVDLNEQEQSVLFSFSIRLLGALADKSKILAEDKPPKRRKAVKQNTLTKDTTQYSDEQKTAEESK